ncbi:MAG: choice-of-anchor J domain-containing protein, partial [Bacteroidales bacterium]|nr:choice-of-anchor J domain-containing protein [Bacteroidales bacterium]
MKHFYSFLVLTLALCLSWSSANAQTLTVHDGESTNSYVPVNGLWADAYLKCEYIMPATELADMNGKVISDMTWYLSSPAAEAWTGTFQIFMKEVGFTEISAYQGTEGATVVYEGTLDATSSTLLVEFTTPYFYSGGNLLIGVYQTVKGNYKSCSFTGEDVTGACVQGYSSTSLDAVTATQRDFIPKTTFSYGEPPACLQPTNLVVNYTGGTTATVSWSSAATAFNLEVNGGVTSITENPYTLTGLDLATTYEVKVQADCGGGEFSNWTSGVTFTTDLCMPEDQCEITIVLTDSYGDGWNGNKMNVVDALTDVVLGTYTLPTSTSEETFTLSVCNGRDIDFVYDASGSFPTENGWTITDNNGEVITEHEGCGSGCALGSGVVATFTQDCTPPTCPKPTHFAVNSLGSREVELSWFNLNHGSGTWWIQYSELSDFSSSYLYGVITTSYPNDSIVGILDGLDPETTYYARVQLDCGGGDESQWSNTVVFTTLEVCPTPAGLAATDITGHTASLGWTGSASSYNVRYRPCSGVGQDFDSGLGEWTTIDADGDGYTWILASETPGVYHLTSADLTGLGYDNSVDFIVSASYSNYTAVELTPDNYLVSPQVMLGGSISFYAQAQDKSYPAEHFGVAVSTTGNTNAADFTTIQEWTMVEDYSATENTWGYYSVDLSDYAGQTGYVAIRHFDCTNEFTINIDDINITVPTSDPWVEATVSTNSLDIASGLEPETDYEFEVQSDCGSDGISTWSHSTFTTDVACMTPIELTAGIPGPRYVDLYWMEKGTASDWDIYVSGMPEVSVSAGETEVTIVNDTVFYTLTGLVAGLDFSVKVRSNCGGEGVSEWSNEVNFTTANACPVPVITTEDITHIMATSANVAWHGFAENDSYEVSYAPATVNSLISEEFSTSIPSGWESKSGLLEDVMNGTELGSTSQWSFGTANGVFDDHAINNIYGSSKKAWLITPAIDVENGSILTFDIALTAYDGTLGAPATTGTDDRFVVLVTTDDEATWTILREWNNSGSEYVYNNIPCSAVGENVSIDLNSYAGQSVHIAFYGESTEYNADNDLHIDNVIVSTIVPVGAWQTVSVASASTTLMDLEPGTPYVVKVKGFCDGGAESNESAVVNFTTLSCNVTSFPWTVDFEDMAENTVPECWDNSASTSPTLGTDPEYIWGVYDDGDNQMMYMYNYEVYPGTALINTPVINLPSMGVYALSFNYAHRASCDPFVVKISTDNGLTFTELQSYSAHDGYSEDVPGEFKEAFISLADYAGESVILQFCAAPTYGYGTIFVDNITIDEAPSCFKPTELEAGSTTANTATLRWTENGTATAWQICLDGDEENLIEANSNPFTIEGLTASTEYTVKVRAYCAVDDQSAWSDVVNVITSCEAIPVRVGQPYVQDFEEPNFPPACVRVIAAAGGNWMDGYQNHTESGSTGAYSYFFGDTYLVLPELEIEDDGNDDTKVKLSFWSYNSYYNYYYLGRNAVVLLDNDNNETVELWSPASVSNEWVESILDLTAYKGQTIKIAFKYEGFNAHGWYLDDIKVGFTCPAPADLAVSHVTDNSADLTWTGTHESYTVRYREATVPTSTQLFSESFEGYADEAALEAVWTVADLGSYSDNTDELGLFASGDASQTGSHGFRFSSYYGDPSGNFDQYLISPEIATPGRLEFAYKSSENEEDVFRVGYSTTTNDIAEFTWGEEIAPDYDWRTFSENMPEDAKYFAINYTAVYAYRLYVDDITIYELQPAGEWQTVNDAGNPTALSSLNSATRYEVMVQGDCGVDGVSPWSHSLFFATQCNPITDLPWSEDFEVFAVKAIPACWDNSSSTSASLGDYPQYIWGVYEYSGNKMLRMNNFYAMSGTALINSPMVNLPAEVPYILAFDYANKATCGDFIVKVSTDYGETFTELGTYSQDGTDYVNPGEFTPAEISLADYAGQTVILQFFANANYGDGAIFLDNVQIKCGDVVVDWEHPFTEGFEGAFPPACWDTINVGSESWTDDNGYHYSGSSSAFSDYYGDVYLVMPELTIEDDHDAATLAKLTFWSYNDYTQDGGRNSVVLLDGGETELWGIAPDEEEWVGDTIDLTAYKGQTIRLAFKYEGHDGHGWYVDDVNVSFYCPAPTNLAASHITKNTADLSWTAAGTEHAWQIMLNDDDEHLIEADANPFTVTGLSANTTYTARVRAFFSTSFQSDWSEEVEFTTKCDAITSFPWSEDFEAFTVDIDLADNCWMNEHISGDDYNLFRVFTDNNGNSTHQLLLPDMEAGTMTKLVLPEMDIPTDDYYFFIDVYRNNVIWSGNDLYEGEGIRVYASTDGEIAGATELAFIPRHWSVEGSNIPAEEEAGWYTYKMPIGNAGTTYIILRGESQYNDGTAMDNFMVQECNIPATTDARTVCETELPYTWNDVVFNTAGTQDAVLTAANGCDSVVTMTLTVNPITYGIDEVTACDSYTWIDGNTYTESTNTPTHTLTNVAGCDSVVTLHLTINHKTYGVDEVTAYGNSYTWIDGNIYDESTDEPVYTIVGGNANGCDSVVTLHLTLSECPLPVLETANVTNITPHTVDVEWTGNMENDSYVVNYRKKAHFDGITEDFSAGWPDGWRVYQGLLEGNTAELFVSPRNSFELSTDSYNSFDRHAKTVIYDDFQHWLVTPAITIADDASLSFDLALMDGVNHTDLRGTDDKFMVLLSNDNMNTWTTLREWNNSGSPYVFNDIANTATGENVSMDIDSYVGQTVYVAFYVESTINNAYNTLHIDNVYIGATVPDGEWQEVTAVSSPVTLSGLESEAEYEVRVQGVCAGGAESEWSDTVSFTTPLSCQKPTDLAVGMTTRQTAALSWTENGSATSWQIMLDNDGANLVTADANPFTIEGLTPNTTYRAKVRAYCGVSDQSQWSNEVVFHTPCDAVTSFPWTENFNDLALRYSIPDCWNNDESTNLPSTVFKWCYNDIPGIGNTGGTSHDGSNCIRFLGARDLNSNFLKTIPLSLPETPMELIFWYKKSVGDLSVYISTDGGYTHETALATDLAHKSDWSPSDPIDLSAYAGQEVVIVFEGASVEDDDVCIYLDDVTVREIPSCRVPTALSAAPSEHSAELSWTANSGETEWTLYWKESNESDYTEVAGVTDNPYTLTGLNDGTVYTYYVVANCSDWEVSEPSGTYEFTTRCDAVTTFPWSEDFEGFVEGVDFDAYNRSLTNPCWKNEPIAGIYMPMFFTSLFTIESTNVAGNSTQKLSYYAEDGMITKLVLPEMDIPTDNYYFFLDVYRHENWHSCATYQNDGIRVYASVDGEIEGATELAFIPRHYEEGNAVIPAEETAGWYTYRLPISNTGTTYIILRGEDQCGNGNFIDNLVVQECNITSTEERVICEAELPYTWDDEVFDEAGTRNLVLTAANGCDSVVTMILTVNYPTTGIDEVTACESYEWIDGVTYTESTNTPTYTLTNAAGCDSVVTLHLTINHANTGIDEVTAYGSYTWIDGNTYTESTDAPTYTLTNAAGCDSVVTLYLTLYDCPVPVLEQSGITNITANSADVEWTGNVGSDSYVVNYRTAESIDVQLSENFEISSAFENNWTVVNYSLGNESKIGRTDIDVHGGEYGFRFSSYNSYTTYEEHLINNNELTGITDGVIEFYYKKDHSLTETFKVGYSNTDNDPASFAFGEDHVAAMEWQLFHEAIPAGTKYVSIQYTTTGCNFYLYIDDIAIGNRVPAGEWLTMDAPSNSTTLAGLEPETEYEVRVQGLCGIGSESEWSDTIRFTTLETCPSPTELTTGTITNHSIELNWTENGSATAWQIMLNDDEENLVDADANPFILDGLALNTTYIARVRAYCSGSDQSEWSNQVNFTTLCDGISDFPWTENFNELTEENSIPDCWNNNEGTTVSNAYMWSYVIATSGNGATNGTSHDGSKCVRFDSYVNPNNCTSFLKTVPLTLPDTPMELTFWYKNPTGGDFSVYISTDGGFTHETALVTGLTDMPEWTWHDPIDLSTYSGQNVVIVFKGTSNYGTGDAFIYLDDVTVKEIPSCAVPTALGATPDIYSADLSWTANSGESEWTIYWKESSEDNYTEVTGVTENPYTLTGLNQNTTYDFYVVANCSDIDASEPSYSYRFTTQCGVISTFPWRENFERFAADNNGINLSDPCWVNEHIGEGTGYLFRVCTSYNGTNSTHQLKLPDMAAGTLTKLMLPEMDIPTDDYYFFLDVYRSSDTYQDYPYQEEGIRVFASTDGEIEGATELGFIPRHYQVSSANIPAEAERGWYTYKLPINNSGTTFIILRGESQYCAPTYMDNFVVQECNIATTDTRTVCASELPLTWNGVLFNEAGTQDAILTAANGCDSVVTMTLTVNTPVHTAMTETACDTYTWTHVDATTQDYTESGDYTYEHADANGCTQVDTLHLTINYSTTGVDEQAACDSYEWIDGVTYTESNSTATFTLTNAAGCDSIVTLNLTINHATNVATTASAVETYTWNHVDATTATYTESGVFTYEHADANGCTQVDTLYLTIYQASENEFAATACESYTWNEQTYTVSGDYVQNFTDIHGADSTVTLHLTINNP